MRKIIAAAGIMTLLSSCVTRKLYNELDASYKQCMEERDRLLQESDGLRSKTSDLENASGSLQSQLDQALANRDSLQIAYNQLQKNYEALEKNSDAAIKAEIERLNKIKGSLDKSTSRVSELEGKLAAQDANLKRLKEALSKALYAFEGKGLTVEQKNGKVYVSMENKLLFPSGSWTVSSEGKQAVQQLADVLAKNPDIAILIEGHTDNDKVMGNLGNGVTNNWDLSTKRATAIVTIIEQTRGIDKRNLTAAGRSEFAPVASNAHNDGKAKNRRIEVILTPKLDEISKMLDEI